VGPAAESLGSPAQGQLIRAGARGWVWCTAVVHGGGWGWAGQVHCTPQHQVTHVTYRVQHLREQWGYRFKQVPTRNEGQEQSPSWNTQQVCTLVGMKI